MALIVPVLADPGADVLVGAGFLFCMLYENPNSEWRFVICMPHLFVEWKCFKVCQAFMVTTMNAK
jgi:hypothetical protein